jgi:DNA-binding beta-propeller fold protein YncE
MVRMLALCALLTIGCSLQGMAATAAPQPGPLSVDARITLGDIAGRIDHLAFDPTRQRLYVAELGNDSIGIIDLNQKRLLRTVPGFSEPQGIAYEPSTDSIYVANGGEGAVRVFRASDFAALATIRVGADPDNVRVDTDAKRVYVGYGSSSGAIAIIDPAARMKIGDIPLKKHPESFQLEHGDRIFVNVPEAGEIAVVSRASRSQVASWPTGNLHANFPLALDGRTGRVIAIFRSPARMASFDVNTGKRVASVATCADADDTFIDAKRNRIYVVCGDGYVDAFEMARGDKYSRLGRLATSPGTRTGLFIPEWDRLAVAIRASARRDAALWLLE